MTKLTKRTVDALKTEAKDYFVWDSQIAGFGLRVMPSGVKTYQAQYRKGGRTRRVTDEREQIMDTCEKQLMHHIRTGALRSFAFGAPRTHEASPIELSPRIWNGQLDWYQSKITHESLTFVEVRLITAKKAQALLDSTPPVKAPPKPVSIVHEPPSRGRPTVKNEVEQAFRALHAANRINTEFSSKSHYPIIREWFLENAKSISVRPTTMSDETIRRITAPLFNALKDDQ